MTKELKYNLCASGTLKSIVYCCSTSKPCPIRDRALSLLGIPPEKFEAIKNNHKIEDPNLCFGNLAFCCALSKKCKFRDSVLKRLGWDEKKYLEYKKEILKDFMKLNPDPEIWNRRVVDGYKGILRDRYGNKYEVLLFGSLELGFIQLLEWKKIESGVKK
ncbi:MAG: hypothetical protein DRP01_00480 [Archaeoglobales archaeon]|nr:MAG: hypothetical protein DRP01_00480 [Archaeoglobales archaeon]